MRAPAIAAIASLLVAVASPASATAEEREGDLDEAPQPESERDSAASPDPEPDPPPRGAPPPEEASGIREPAPSSHWRALPRLLLFVPRSAVALAAAPVRLVTWAYARYELEDRFYRAFFNEEGTIGLFPVVFYESGLGLNAGARFVHRDLGGEGGRLGLRLGAGGEDEVVATATLSSGEILRDLLELSFRATYQSRNRSRFFGYGNGDLEDPMGPPGTIDPLADDTAVKTRYSHRDVVAELDAVRVLAASLSTRLQLAYRNVEFRDDVDPLDVPIEDVYDPGSLPGFATGLNSVSGRLELVYDSRRTRFDFLSEAAPSTGWRLAGFAGYQLGLGDDRTRFFRYGGELQRNIDLYRGDRVLVLRSSLEAISADIDEVPFVDLAALGGKHRLRGYPSGRFRDRVAALASAEYRYPISRNAHGFLAVDGGRVWRELSDVDASGLRAGFGGGVQLHTDNSFIARLSLFTSVDGGVEARVVFDPTVPKRERRKR